MSLAEATFGLSVFIFTTLLWTACTHSNPIELLELLGMAVGMTEIRELAAHALVVGLRTIFNYL